VTDQALTGAVALVTGASSGIGAATARRLAQDGAAVAVVARRQDRLTELAAGITAAGGKALALAADITDPDSARDVVAQTVERLGWLDVLVNNAGIMRLDSALHTVIEDWDRMVAVNVKGLLQVTHAAVPYLIDGATTSPRGVSDIVNVSAVDGRVARPGSSVYSLTKSGLNGFAESLRQELLVEGVRVSVVAPDTVDTELTDHLHDGQRAATHPRVSGVEPLQPGDVAEAIAYIVTEPRRVAVNEILMRARDQTW